MAGATIAVASDHAGFDLKEILKRDLQEAGHDVLDLGTNSTASVDYPDFGHAMADAIASGEAGSGVLVCGTGIGISIAANRHPKVRAALAHDVTSARLCARAQRRQCRGLRRAPDRHRSGARSVEGVPRDAVRRRPSRRPRRQAFKGLNEMSQAAAKMNDAPLPMFTKSLAEADPAVDAAVKGELHRQQDQIELIASENIVSRAVLEAAGLGADQQICRGLSRPALLRRLRVRRHGRAARHRARLQAVRLQLRQRAAAFRRAGQPGGVHGAAQARRHLHGHGARPGRPPDARLARQPVGQVVQGRVLRREARHAPDRLRADGSGRAQGEAEADHRRRLGLFAHHRLRALPQGRRRDRRLLHGRHGALCRAWSRPASIRARCRTPTS